MGKETRQQAPQYKLHYMCLPWCYRTMITSYQLPWCYRTMVSSYLLLLKTLFSPTLLLLSYHGITIAPKIYCKWTSLSDRTYRTNLGVYKSNLCFDYVLKMLTTYVLFQPSIYQTSQRYNMTSETS